MKLKRENKISNVKTIDGLVFVRTNVTDNMTCIRLLRDLELFIAKSTSQMGNQPAPNSTAVNGITPMQQIQPTQPPMTHPETQYHQQNLQSIPNYNQNTMNPMETH